jgi:hypothetical protein
MKLLIRLVFDNGTMIRLHLEKGIQAKIIFVTKNHVKIMFKLDKSIEANKGKSVRVSLNPTTNKHTI